MPLRTGVVQVGHPCPKVCSAVQRLVQCIVLQLLHIPSLDPLPRWAGKSEKGGHAGTCLFCRNPVSAGLWSLGPMHVCTGILAQELLVKFGHEGLSLQTGIFLPAVNYTEQKLFTP